MRDPLDNPAGPDTTWTTVNLAEAFPGVPTPLGWTWAWQPTEYGLRWTFADIGALSVRESAIPTNADDAFTTIFRGKATANLDKFRAMGDAMPGGSANGVEQGLFGSVRPGVSNRPNYRRYPVVAAKLPITAFRSRRRLNALVSETTQWWQELVQPGAITSADAARRAILEAQTRYATIARSHGTASMIAQALYEQIRSLCERNNMPGLESRVATFHVEESKLIDDLAKVSRGKLDLADFLADHGYHGPWEGEITSLSWREDPTPINALLRGYAAGNPAGDPEKRAMLRREEQVSARAELLSKLRLLDRVKARMLLALARRYLPLREQGRATFLRAYDVARAAARVLGDHMAREGLLDVGEDVAYLTVDEVIQTQPPTNARDLVGYRKQARLTYLAEKLPAIWSGPAIAEVAKPNDDLSGDGENLEVIGLGASSGIAEGAVRVITDPADVDTLEPGEILVCHTTDPSWAPALYLAAAAVIDVGGAISHGAIVARELGIPCVINTGEGTSRLRTGQLVRVDGQKGTVFVMADSAGDAEK